MATRIGGRRPDGQRRIAGCRSGHQRLPPQVEDDPGRPPGQPRRLVFGMFASMVRTLSRLAHAGPPTTAVATRAGSEFARDG